MTDRLTILNADALTGLKQVLNGTIQCCVTSPPYYGLRSYLKADDPAKANEIGSEPTPQAYIDHLVEVFREVKRALREDGVLWLNLGDSYNAGASTKQRAWRNGAGRADGQVDSRGQRNRNGVSAGDLKPKDLLMIPARVAMALQADGWYLRAACPWIKRNAMPESVQDRPTQTIEYLYMLTKSEHYHYDAEAVKVPAKKGACGSRFDTGKTAEHQQNRSSTKERVEDGTRLRRSADWFFRSWQGLLQDEDGDPLAFVVNTKGYKGAHFACFPPELIRPCIQSSVSEKGACPECGAPFERVTERKAMVIRRSERTHELGRTRSSGTMIEAPTSKTIGWEPTCSHVPTETSQCVVLDPFGGSGTTAQVALELGCRAVLVELNAEYIPLIHQRCGL